MTSSRSIAGSVALCGALVLFGCAEEPPAQMATASVDETEDAPAAAERKTPAPRPGSVRLAEPKGNRTPVIKSLAVTSDEEDPSRWVARYETADPDGDEVNVEVVWFVNDQPVTRGKDHFDPTAHRRGDFVTVEVTPRDRETTGAPARSGRIEIANAAPEITSQPMASMAGGVYRYVVEAKDPEGDAPLRYRLLESPEGMRIDPYNGELTWRPSESQVGTHTVKIAVKDSRGAQSIQEFALPITAPSGSTPAAPAP